MHVLYFLQIVLPQLVRDKKLAVTDISDLHRLVRRYGIGVSFKNRSEIRESFFLGGKLARR